MQAPLDQSHMIWGSVPGSSAKAGVQTHVHTPKQMLAAGDKLEIEERCLQVFHSPGRLTINPYIYAKLEDLPLGSSFQSMPIASFRENSGKYTFCPFPLPEL